MMIALRTAAIGSLFLSCIPGLPAQVRDDTVPAGYDSLQDARVNRMEQRIDRRIYRMEENQEDASFRIDSLERMLEALVRQIQQLEKENEVQDEALDGLTAGLGRLTGEVGRQEEAARLYRAKYRRLLGWSTGGILLLLSAGFVFLLVFSIRTRQLLKTKIRGVMEGTDTALNRIKRKQKKFREKLLARVEADHRALRSRIRAQRKAVRRTARKEVRAELRSARK